MLDLVGEEHTLCGIAATAGCAATAVIGAYGASMHVEDDFEPWTQGGAARLTAAGEHLAQAVREHAEVVAASAESQDIQAVFAAGEALMSVMLAYADAQFSLTGSGFPFGALHELAADEDEDEDAEDVVMGAGLSVVSRQDFLIADEKAVLGAGREAYLSLWPEDPATAAAEDVNHIGRALYQYTHLHGWDKLREMDGLVPVSAVTAVQAHEDLL